jgi:Ran GTPase-activating protein (RanGAP) involved in mRNA processing and transport
MTVHVTLHTSGPRNVVQVADAEAILQNFQATLARYTTDDGSALVDKLDLSGRAWPLSSLQVLEAFFEAHVVDTVRVLKIDDIIASLPTVDGLASLRWFARVFQHAPVAVLNLNDNALGTRGMAEIRPLLSNPHIRHLALDNVGISEAVVATLATILSHSSGDDPDTPGPLQLQSLSLGRNQIGIEGARSVGELLALCPHLESFSYASSRPQLAGTLALVQGLEKSEVTSLRYLNFEDCVFRGGDGEDPTQVLKTVLCRSPKLHTLLLPDCELGPAGLLLVILGIRYAKPPLTVLDLSANNAGPGGTYALGELLEYTDAPQTLQSLAFDNNEVETADVLNCVLRPVIRSPRVALRELRLEGNELEGLALQLLIDNPIPSLRALHLEENMDIGRQRAQRLQALYQTMGCVVYVDENLEIDENDDHDEEQKDDDAVDALVDSVKGLAV